MRSAICAYRFEPAVPDPPRRVTRDWLVVAAMTVSAVLEGLLAPDVPWRWAALVVCLAVVPLQLYRRTHPLAVVAGGFGIMMSLNLAGWVFTERPVGLVAGAFMLVPVYALYRWGSGREGLWGGVVLVVAAVIGNVTDSQTVGDVIGGVIVLTIPVEAALVVRYRGAARARLLDEVKSRERELIARDLHDTVAHHVSAIAIRAQAGLAVAASDPSAAVDALRIVSEEASRTLAEMRAMVHVLRRGDAADMAPNPRVADVFELATDAAVAPIDGVAVTVVVDGDVDEVPEAIGAAVFRLAQESVTNARRHARHATRVAVRVSADRDTVHLSVTDDGDPVPATGWGVGYGLVGMRERTDLLGGTLAAGPGSGRGWAVSAVLPRREGVRLPDLPDLGAKVMS